jgi:alkanesulfonate monooxygenase SsuD/methylene tetrahydromethanopterin reductase-like flavin-dependent oxidoreductase (luciferase family)
MLVGSPARVARQIDEAVTAGEVNHLAAAFAWGSLPHAASLRSMRLFRDEVIPALRHGGR